MEDDESGIEILEEDLAPNDAAASAARRSPERRIGPVLLGLALGLVLGLVLWSAFSGGEREPTSRAPAPVEEDGEARRTSVEDARSSRLEAALVAQSVPPPLLAAELFVAEPTASGLRELFRVAGGFDGLELGTADGAFDLVRFDPQDSDRLLASRRSSYGDAQNNDQNEMWTWSDDGSVDQQVWGPDRSHDFAHFNVDGTVSMWIHGGGDGFAPRQAVLLDGSLDEVRRTESIYASRFSAVDGTLFALTGDGDYYSNQTDYVSLVADTADERVTLDEGGGFGWIDNPTPDVLVAYPSTATGSTVVWDTATLEQLPAHPLAGRRSLRAAVSGDRKLAVLATTDGRLEVVELESGRSRGVFGEVDVVGVDQPISLNENGTVAVTVERSGLVTIWWVGDDEPVASIVADAGQPRWVSARYSPTSASAVAPDGSRIALRVPARGATPTRYALIDVSVESWVDRACALAGRALTESEALALGLPDGRRACVG